MRTGIAALVFVAACGGKQATSPTTSAHEPPGPAAKPALPDVPFDKLDHEQQKQFMEDVVFAPLKKAFQDHDPKRFAKFQCETCHGPSAAKDEFDMPNPDLPKLNFSDMTKWKPADVDWMTNVVKPTMAKLLKLPEMSRDNPKGFGCENCHTETGGS